MYTLCSLALAVIGSLPLSGLRTAVVGGGASGLLLAHRLLDAGASVNVLEARSDPRDALSEPPEGRAYALGLGLRGRTAIGVIDDPLQRIATGPLWERIRPSLWSAVEARGE